MADYELWTRWKDGDRDAADQLCSRYLRLAKNIAGGLVGSRGAEDWKDLVQDGFEALLAPRTNYDPTRFPNFGAWASTVLKRRMLLRWRERQGFTRTQLELVERVREAHDALMADPDRSGQKPTVEEVAEKAAVTVDQIYDAFKVIAVGEPAPLLEADPDTIEDARSDVDGQVIRRQEIAALHQALRTLNPP